MTIAKFDLAQSNQGVNVTTIGIPDPNDPERGFRVVLMSSKSSGKKEQLFLFPSSEHRGLVRPKDFSSALDVASSSRENLDYLEVHMKKC